MLRAVVAFHPEDPAAQRKKKKRLSGELLENSFDLFRKTAKNYSHTEKANLLELPH